MRQADLFFRWVTTVTTTDVAVGGELPIAAFVELDHPLTLASRASVGHQWLCIGVHLRLHGGGGG